LSVAFLCSTLPRFGKQPLHQVARETASELPVPLKVLQRVIRAPVHEGIASDFGDHGFFHPFPRNDPIRVFPVPSPERRASFTHFSGCQQEIQDQFPPS
jgi:hypothetical protein